MSDITQTDTTLDLLRQHESELAAELQAHEIAGGILAGKLAVLRVVIADATRKTRPARKPRVVAVAADGASEPPTEPEPAAAGPMPITVALDAALASLGRAVRAQDAQMVAA